MVKIKWKYPVREFLAFRRKNHKKYPDRDICLLSLPVGFAGRLKPQQGGISFYRSMPDTDCIVCGETFHPRGSQKTCLPECQHQNNLRHHREKKRRWRRERPDEMRAKARDYQSRNIDHAREYDTKWKRAWREAHPGEEAAYALARRPRADQRHAPRTPPQEAELRRPTSHSWNRFDSLRLVGSRVVFLQSIVGSQA
jgi:hypothetical protein